MKSKVFAWSVATALAVAVVPDLHGQAPRVEFPAPSPLSTVKQRVGLTDIEVVYSRPGVKGRSIFGGLVPYGEVWRTGANQSTKITFSTPVKLDGAAIPAGTYALYTIPKANEWTIIIYKNTALPSTASYDPKDDVARVNVKPTKLSQAVETFTIDVNDVRDESATLNLTWAKTRVSVKLEVELTSKLVPQIEAVMAAPEGTKPYYQAAMFYYDHGITCIYQAI